MLSSHKGEQSQAKPSQHFSSLLLKPSKASSVSSWARHPSLLPALLPRKKLFWELISFRLTSRSEQFSGSKKIFQKGRLRHDLLCGRTTTTYPSWSARLLRRLPPLRPRVNAPPPLPRFYHQSRCAPVTSHHTCHMWPCTTRCTKGFPFSKIVDSWKFKGDTIWLGSSQ
jgi:hypothetical protein